LSSLFIVQKTFSGIFRDFSKPESKILDLLFFATKRFVHLAGYQPIGLQLPTRQSTSLLTVSLKGSQTIIWLAFLTYSRFSTSKSFLYLFTGKPFKDDFRGSFTSD
jgi:hypothetical protein